MTSWDKSCCRVEEGEHGPWVGTMEADGNLDSRVRGGERKNMGVCAYRHILRLALGGGHLREGMNVS